MIVDELVEQYFDDELSQEGAIRRFLEDVPVDLWQRFQARLSGRFADERAALQHAAGGRTIGGVGKVAVLLQLIEVKERMVHAEAARRLGLTPQRARR